MTRSSQGHLVSHFAYQQTKNAVFSGSGGERTLLLHQGTQHQVEGGLMPLIMGCPL